MAFLGIFGPHAIGKTTALGSFVEGACRSLPHVTVVRMDNNWEAWWEDGQLQEHRYKGRKYWKGSREDKLSMIMPCIEATQELVVAETARISHVHQSIVDGYKQYGGGARVIIVTCEPGTMRTFLMARCESKGKQFNAKYWDQKRLVYESKGRYLNAAEKYFTQNGIPWEHFIIDQDRTKWLDVLRRIKAIANLPLDSWY